MAKSDPSMTGVNSAVDGKELHVVMVPWLAFGHLIPFLELSKCLANSGVNVTFVSTPRNIDRLPRVPPHLASRIDRHGFRLPEVDGLPPRAEATVDLEPDAVPYLKKAYDTLKEPVKELVETLSPDWIIYDLVAYWVPQIAAELRVPCAFYSVYGASAACFLLPHVLGFPENQSGGWTPEKLTVTPDWFNFPSSVKYKPHEVIDFSRSISPNASDASDKDRFYHSFGGCQCILIRSCREFEGEYLDLMERLVGRPVLPVGLLPSDQSVWDQNPGSAWPECCKWLDAREPKSVVFVGFGTEATFTKEQVHEIASGLELSELPFFWVLRVAHGDRETELPLPSGFADRTASRGLVCTKWVPQVKILAHPAIGGCLHHGGLSSNVESLQFGLPLVLLPMVFNQGLDARLLVERKVAMEVERDEATGKFSGLEVAKSIRRIMVEGEGQSVRDMAKEMESVFGGKELNDGYVGRLAGWLRVHKNRAA